MMRALSLPILLAFTAPALAGSSSVYTDFDLSKCQQVSPETSGDDGESSGVFECQGHGKYVVTFMEGDLRSFVTFGIESDDTCARTQTFGGFNSIAGKKIEWRVHDVKPVAAIQRWSVSYDPEDSVKQREWLVVTRIEDDNACHMAYVEAAYPNANAVAQNLVDALAPNFSCSTSKPVFVARIGTETEGIAANGGCPAN